MKNYSEELDLEQDIDILLLTAIMLMLNYADSFFENQVADDGSDQMELYRSSDHIRPLLTEHSNTEVIWNSEHLDFPDSVQV